MAKVKLENVYKVYEGGVRAVNDFNLDIPDKEFDEYCETYRIYHDELGGNHTGTQKYNYVMEHLERRL